MSDIKLDSQVSLDSQISFEDAVDTREMEMLVYRFSEMTKVSKKW